MLKRGVDTRAAPCEAPTGMGRAGRTGNTQIGTRARAPRTARGAEERRPSRARRAEAARAPRRARARARTGRLGRPAGREPLARRPARHRCARSPGLRLPASQGARRGDIATRAPGYVARARARERRRASLRPARRRGSRGARRRATPPAAETCAPRGARALARARRSRTSSTSRSRRPRSRGSRSSALVALEERIEADLALGRHAELVAELEALVAAHPLRERPRAQLMLALYRSGRQADALAAYRAARDTLVEELGIEPGPELKALEAAILRQDESLLLRGDAAGKARDAVPPARHDPLRRRRRVDGARGGARRGGARPGAPALLRDRLRGADSARRARSRSSPATPSWRPSASRSRTRTTRCAPPAPPSTSVRGSLRSNAHLVEEHGIGLEVRIGIETGEVVATATDARQRLVTGEAVGIAARLEQAAGSDEIFVGELAGRLIDHAARLEPLGELDDQGQGAGTRVPAARARGRRARLRAPPGRTSRRAEARARRAAPSLKRAIDGELGARRRRRRPARRRQVAARRGAHPAREGRDDALGPLPLVRRRHHVLAAREVLAAGAAVRGAGGSPRRPRRRHAAARARDRLDLRAVLRVDRGAISRLVLVFDDVHWAEPTFLELIELPRRPGQGRSSSSAWRGTSCSKTGHRSSRSGRTSSASVLDALSAEDTDSLWTGSAERSSSGISARESPRRQRGTRSSSSSSSPSRSKEVSRSRRCRKRCRRCWRRASTGWAGERAVLERGSIVPARSSRPRT